MIEGLPTVLLANLYDVRISVFPLSRTCARVFHSRRLATGSTPVVGSSRKMIDGLPISAIPVLNFLLLPPLKTTNIYIYIQLNRNDVSDSNVKLRHRYQTLPLAVANRARSRRSRKLSVFWSDLVLYFYDMIPDTSPIYSENFTGNITKNKHK